MSAIARKSSEPDRGCDGRGHPLDRVRTRASLRVDANVDPVDVAVERIRDVHRRATVAAAVSIGEVVFVEIFRADINALHSHGEKDESFRRLANHPRLPFSAVTLWRFTSIFVLAQRFPGLLNAKHVGVAHLRAIIGLNSEQQEQLIRLAEVERWTKETMEARAAQLRDSRSGRGGRRPTPSTLKSLAIVRRLALDGRLTFVQRDLAALSQAEAAAALDAIQKMRNWCELFEASLKTPAAVLSNQRVPSNLDQ